VEIILGKHKSDILNFFLQKILDFRSSIIVVLIFFFNLFLVLSKLTPRLTEINPHDGAKYIESGRLLLIWGLRDLAWGPLVAFIYAPIHLLVGNSPNWFIIEAWAGNIILFGLIWFGFYALASQFDKFISKIAVFGILLTTTVYFPIIENQSDALFVSLSCFALVHVIKFYKKGELKNIWIASLFVGLGILSRVETILLIVPLLVISLFLNNGKHKWVKVLFAATIPIIVLITVFVVINFITFGHANLGLGYKSYDSFQMNQAFLPGSNNQEAYFRGEKIFGTIEENEGSVLRAILRNPVATGERALVNLIDIPERFKDFFGNLQAPIVFAFSLIGIYQLLREKKYILIGLLLIWPLHAFVSLIFLPRHIIPQMSYFFIVLSGIGITFTFSEKISINERLVFFIGSIVLIISAAFFRNKILFSNGVLFFVASFLSLLLAPNAKSSKMLRELPIVIMLIGGLLFGNGFTFPAKLIGRSENEQAVQNLQVLIPNNSRVLVPLPTFAIAAKMTPVEFPRSITTNDEFIAFLIDKKIDSVYVDKAWPQYSDFIMAAIAGNQSMFQLMHESESERILIYLVDLQISLNNANNSK